ncbi:hypothetical protein D3C78_904790 [compost metagenome]
MQQQVAVGADHLPGQLWLGGVGGSGELRGVASLAAGLIEQVLAGQHLRGADIAPGWHAQVAGVKGDQAQDVVADFLFAVGAVAIGGCKAIALRWGAVVPGLQGAGQAHVTGKSVHVLLVDIRLPGLPAEATDHGLALGVVPNPVGPAANTVAVAIIGVFVGQNLSFGDGFEQAQADHGRCHACREPGVRVHRPIAELGDLQGRATQFDLMAVVEADGLVVVSHAHLAFRGHTRVGHVLQLGAIDRLRDHAQALDFFCQVRLVGDRQAHQHRHRVAVARLWRMATAVAYVAVLTGVGVEQWAQAIACSGGGRGDHPGVAEETVAYGKVQAALGRQVGRGQGKGIAVVALDSRLATGQRFARLCLSETRGVVTGGKGEGQQRRGESGQRQGHAKSWA